MSVSTPGGRYLARQFTLIVPLQESDNTQPNYLFAPIEVTLYPAASYAIEPPWAIIRLRVVQQGVNPAVPLADRRARHGKPVRLGSVTADL